jgi:hypothetical protein
MTQIAPEDFINNLSRLLKATFEDGGSFYLDRGAGLFHTLESMTAEAASRAPVPGAPTIAAHCVHHRYYVRVVLDCILKREQEPDWPSSWRVQQVGPDEWEALKRELRSGYEQLPQALASVQTWDEGALADSMAILAHTAYHLGAIRQIIRAAK